MLAFRSRPKPLVMKNLTPYLYLTLGREGIGRTLTVYYYTNLRRSDSSAGRVQQRPRALARLGGRSSALRDGALRCDLS